ncbi:hypothetical protein C8R31_101765 [Nitrosospira sp. Nsp2]|uniref:hypothetical protein n=1 Tax=Nitrosospira sp. Nsp2 TaxID=136548 RepID=UPI000D32214E|nr:hypothetical protein [Nitrosospira sp. Nsp2]PTR17601.1 hypothetical protein C8R31_101765 [Nitrosospira sp. Nsp2]
MKKYLKKTAGAISAPGFFIAIEHRHALLFKAEQRKLAYMVIPRRFMRLNDFSLIRCTPA